MIGVTVIEQRIPAPTLAPEGRRLIVLTGTTFTLSYLRWIHLPRRLPIDETFWYALQSAL